MIDVSRFQPTDEIAGEDAEETKLLKEMFQDALAYIEGFSWAEPIAHSYLAFGVGGVFALFLFEFEKEIAGTDKELWIVSGDLPDAYFVTDDVHTVADAVDTYCSLMEDWIGAAEQNDNETKVFPVKAPRTKENADALKRRIAFIRDKFL